MCITFLSLLKSTMKLNTISIASIYIAFLIFSISLTRFHASEAAGFTIDLIHRDSLESPSLYSVLTPSVRVKNALQRSFSRVNSLRYYDSFKSVSTDVVSNNGEYLMRFSLGTPPVETLAIADTGSDLTWIQCKPCIQCFKQKAPVFDPNRSSTYKPVSCTSNACSSCDSSNNCNYVVEYGDRSYSRGDIAKETLTLGSTVIHNVTIGCGHSNQGTFGGGTSGIIGLGGGKVSLIKQIGSSIQGKFSYCLVPYLNETQKPSKMNFGDNALVLGVGVVTTPIVSSTPDTFYFLTLEGMTIGNQRLNFYGLSSSYFSDPKSVQEGNIIIDSGTTLTFLPTEFYNQVITAVKRQVKSTQVSDPQGLLNLCYLPTGNVEVPEITVHFKGADVKLKSVNTFVKTSETSLCLAFAPASNLAIYGNLAQMNFLIGYDLEKKTVSFKPTNCSKK